MFKHVYVTLCTLFTTSTSLSLRPRRVHYLDRGPSNIKDEVELYLLYSRDQETPPQGSAVKCMVMGTGELGGTRRPKCCRDSIFVVHLFAAIS